MKINFYFYIFLLISLILSILFFPKDNELVYVFEKSNNLVMLEKYYHKKLKTKYDNLTEYKYLSVLKKLKKKDFYKKAEIYVTKSKDIKFIDEVIDFALSENNKKEYVRWLEVGYQLTGNVGYLKKLLNYYSYIHDKKNVITVLKRLYFVSGNKKFLDELYGIGNTDFVIDEYLKNKNFSKKELQRIVAFFAEKKDYGNYLKFLEIAYNKTDDVNYLIQEKNLYSYLHDTKNVINILKRIFGVTGDYNYLDELYSLGEKKYVISQYNDDFNKLTINRRRLLLKYYIWEGDKENVLRLIKKFITEGSYTRKDLKDYVNILSYLSKYNDLIELYKFLYKKTGSNNYLLKLATTYDYYGFPYESCKVLYKLFKLTGKEKYLNMMIYNYSRLNDFDNYLKFTFIKLKNFYSEKLLKSTVSFLIDNKRFNQAVKLTEQYFKHDKKLLHYLVLLYLIENKERKALELLLNVPADMLTKDELLFIAGKEKIHKKFIPYFIKIYKLTKNKYYLFKILKYYASKKDFYHYIKFFEKYLGKINEKNYLTYIAPICENSERECIKEAIRIAKSVFNIKLLNNLAVFLMEKGEQKESMKIFKKVLYLQPDNLIAIENLGKLYYSHQNFSRALSLFLKFNTLNPGNSVVNFYIGEIYYNRKHYKLSQKYFKFVVKNIKKDTLEKRMIYLKSFVFLYGIDKVLNEYRSVVKESGYNEDIYADFIDALYFSKKFNLLHKEYDKFKTDTKYKNNTRLLRLFAYYNIEINNFDEALRLLAKAKAIYDDKGVENLSLQRDYGYLYLRLGDKIKALNYYKKAWSVDKCNKELARTVRQLQDELSRNVTFFYNCRNSVQGTGFDMNFPMKEKIWVGIGYRLYDFDKYELFLKFRDINKKFVNFEFGKRHLDLSIGNKFKFYIKESVFNDYRNAVKEDMLHKKLGADFSYDFKDVTFYVNLDKNFYNNNRGKIAETVSSEFNFSYAIDDFSYLSTGFNYVKLNFYKKQKSKVFFNDYRAINLFYTKNYYFENEASKFDWSIGAIYDLILQKTNYSFSLSLKYKNILILKYGMYYDTFSKEQVNMFESQIRIRF